MQYKHSYNVKKAKRVMDRKDRCRDVKTQEHVWCLQMAICSLQKKLDQVCWSALPSPTLISWLLVQITACNVCLVQEITPWSKGY